MELKPEHITIAVTVFNRRDFLLEAIQSALNQTVPVKVIVVEDHGPDPTLRDFVLAKFAGRIEYFRNPQNRGLFDNWNACMEYCATSWLSILHDDDRLQPDFVKTMLALSNAAPDRALYHGQSAVLHDDGKITPPPPVTWKDNWQGVDLVELSDQSFIMLFPGNLFHVETARAIGGVRSNSFYTGDWDLWFRLALRGGAVRTAATVAVMRSHYGAERGSTRVDRMGWRWALENVQRKRNLALLRLQKNIRVPFDRTRHLRHGPIPSRVLLNNAHRYSGRILRYNAWLFTRSRPPHARYAALQWLVRLFGPRMLRAGSALSKEWRDDPA